MASSSNNLEIGGASNHTGSVSDLAFRVREAGSGYSKSCKHPKPTFRVASLNVRTLKKRSSEVVETLARRRADICSVQEHRWAGGIEANQTCLMKGKNWNYKFYWCGNQMGLGDVGLLLAEKWTEKVFDVKRQNSSVAFGH